MEKAGRPLRHMPGVREGTRGCLRQYEGVEEPGARGEPEYAHGNQRTPRGAETQCRQDHRGSSYVQAPGIQMGVALRGGADRGCRVDWGHRAAVRTWADWGMGLQERRPPPT